MDKTANGLATITQDSICAAVSSAVKQGKTLSPQMADYIFNLLSIKRMLEDGAALGDTPHEAEANKPQQPSQASTADEHRDLEEELVDAKKYLDRYKATKDGDYLRMAREELSHAKKFLLSVQKTNPNSQRFNNDLVLYNKLETELAK